MSLDTTSREMDDLKAMSDEELVERSGAMGALVQQNSSAAAEMLSRLAAEAKRRGLGDLQAQCSYLAARAEVNQGHLPAALALIEAARDLWLESGDIVSALRTDLGRMHVLDDLGRHADAIAVGEALVARLDQEDVPAADREQAAWMRAAALENLGVGLGYMGNHVGALDAYARAEATYRDMGLEDEIPRPLANRGVELIELGRYQEAIEALSTAADGFSRAGDDLFVGKCFAYTAQAALLLGDYIAAAAAAQRADKHLAGQPATTEYARAQLVRAETLTSLNLLDEALEVFDAVLPQLADAALQHDLADATYGRGVALARLGRSERALDDFRTAAGMYIDMTAPAMAATALLAQSELAAGEQAEGLVDAALEALKASGRTPHYAAALVRKAQLASPDGAADALHTAAGILADLDAPGVEWRVHHEQARLLSQRGELEQAATELERALELIDAMRRTVVGERQRMFFMAGRDAVLEDLVELQLESGDVAAAYRTSEEARARTLVERQRGELTGSAVTIVTSELDVIYSELLRAAPGEVRTLRSNARSIERRLGEIPRRPQHPADHDTVAIASAAATVVTYQTIGDEVVAFVGAGEAPEITRELASVREIRALLGQLDVQWRRFRDPGLAARQHAHLLAAANDVLQQLYLRLVAGVSGLPSSGSLLIVPCEPIGNVPFAALHDGVGYLVERATISVAPSRTAAEHAESGRRREADADACDGGRRPWHSSCRS